MTPSPRFPRLGRVALFALVALAGASRVGAQLMVVGVVRDSSGAPITSAEVTVLGRKTLSDSLGRFFVSHSASDVIDVSVRRLGYETVTFSVSSSDAANKALDVVMRRIATALDVVTVEEMSARSKSMLKGFDQRRERGVGVFVTREDIEKRNTRKLSDVLRQQRGVVMGKGGVLRFSNYQTKNCLPQLWLDGQQAQGLDLDGVTATEVSGVELYQSLSTTPPEFHRGNQMPECGTIVIWTRRPAAERRP